MNRNFTAKKYALALTAMCLILVSVTSWAGSQVPFKATLSLVAQPATSNRCPSGTFLLQISGGGHATQMGAITDSQGHCQNPVTGAATDGEYVLTTVSGDTIFGSYSAQLIPAAGNTFSIQGQFTITGGTGRFSGATGGGTAGGTQFPNGEATLVLNGPISSGGSN